MNRTEPALTIEAMTIDELTARMAELRRVMATAKSWPSRELREFLRLCRAREQALRAAHPGSGEREQG